MSNPTRALVPESLPKLGLLTATLVVVANMVGTGVFTTTGFLIRDLGSPLVILLGWGLGGVIALCGALAYGELAAALSTNGGEYAILSRLYHPAVGFVAGWVSLVVGFSAPIAAASIAFGEYVNGLYPGVSATGAAVALVVFASLMHSVHVRAGAGVQNLFTLGKVALVAVFIVGGLWRCDVSELSFRGPDGVSCALFNPLFAVGLIFISFAYSGWNGAAYIAGEVKKPQRYLPLALVLGTVVVTLLYLGLNLVFLASAPADELAGKVNVGHVAAQHLFGQQAGRMLSGLIALALVSSVSAMIMVGPRVYEAMGRDYSALRILSLRRGNGGPVVAIALQAGLAIGMLLTSSFDALLTYIGFTLSLCTALTVGGVFVLRRRLPANSLPVRNWGHPVTPVLFILFSCWMAIYAIMERPEEALAGGATVALGLGGYWAARRWRVRPGTES